MIFVDRAHLVSYSLSREQPAKLSTKTLEYTKLDESAHIDKLPQLTRVA